MATLLTRGNPANGKRSIVNQTDLLHSVQHRIFHTGWHILGLKR